MYAQPNHIACNTCDFVLTT